MPRRKRTSKARVSVADLTGPQWLELIIGAGGPSATCVPGCHDLGHDIGCPTSFRDATEAAAAWFAFAAEHGGGQHAGSRYAGWWRWEAQRSKPPITEQPRVLEELGLLEPWERHQIAAWAAIEAIATDDTTDAATGRREDMDDA